VSPAATALALIVGIVALGSAIGFLAARRSKPNLEDWAVAGRGLGLILVWILLAGETFTTYSVLGISGWIYSKGGPTFYALAYLALGYVIIFFIGPPIWELGKKHGLQTLADYFAKAYRSPILTTLVAVGGVVVLVLYLQLQVTGLGIIVNVASYERIGRGPAMVAATVVTTLFVITSGLRGIAWVSILKDILFVGIAVLVGIGIPLMRFGGVGGMFAQLVRERPGFLTMPGGTTNLTHTWFVTTVLVNSLFIGFPHFFGSVFTAKSGDIVRRNAVLMPLYVLPLALIVFAGCSSILIVPHLAVGDLALLTAIRTTLPPWLLGVVGGAGALTAMVPAAVQVLTASTLLAKNVCEPLAGGRMSEARLALLAKISVVAVFGGSLFLALHSSATLVGLLLMAYSGVAQFAPGIILALTPFKVSPRAILCGMVAGFSAAGYLTIAAMDPFHGFNAGFVGLGVNLLVLFAVNSLSRAKEGCFVSANG
jgi:SSS family solute:Na+ symporter